MTRKDFEKAQEILARIQELKSNLSLAEYTQRRLIVGKESTWYFRYVDNIEIKVPKKLFKPIGKLIVTELKAELSELEKELAAL